MPKHILSTLVLTLCIATGCAPKLDGTSVETLSSSSVRVLEGQTDDTKALFELSFRVMGEEAGAFYDGLTLEEALKAESIFRESELKFKAIDPPEVTQLKLEYLLKMNTAERQEGLIRGTELWLGDAKRPSELSSNEMLEYKNRMEKELARLEAQRQEEERFRKSEAEYWKNKKRPTAEETALREKRDRALIEKFKDCMAREESLAEFRSCKAKRRPSGCEKVVARGGDPKWCEDAYARSVMRRCGRYCE